MSGSQTVQAIRPAYLRLSQERLAEKWVSEVTLTANSKVEQRNQAGQLRISSPGLNSPKG